ncbi:MAG: hypothetical protein DRJ18_01740 [Candidatus Methanomethylicota archaeon]|nr:MAG: hypothetical protein DRJ18_01740 [Candidatus Verstraetearchaeota archaeon]
MGYFSKLIKGYLLSYSGLTAIALFFSYIATGRLQSTPIGIESPTLFHGLIVAPSEEMFFRYFVPLLLMYLGLHYLAAGTIAAVGFGMAHWWAYEQNMYALMAAVAAGFWNCIVVYRYSSKEPFNFTPGLLCAMLGHASYNLTVTYAPEMLLPAALVGALAWGFMEKFFREDEDYE